MEATSSKSRCWQGHRPSKGLRGEAVPAPSSFGQLSACLGVWLHCSSLCLHLHLAFSLSVPMSSLFCLLYKHWSLDHGPPRLSRMRSSQDLLLHLQRHCFQIRSHSQVWGFRHKPIFSGLTRRAKEWLQIESLGQLKIHMWNLNLQCDNIWIWGDNLD